MEGSIYNNISKEINFQLPEINFDSDSDEIDDNQPIKPFIRPSAEILFGNDDSDNEEIFNLLSKLPHQESDVANEKDKEDLSEKIINTNMNCELPFNNIKLPTGILHGQPVNTQDQIETNERVILSNFGVRDDIDLDKILEEMDLSNYQTTFFEEILMDPEEKIPETEITTDNSKSQLLKYLDKMSQQYEMMSKPNNSNNNCSQKPPKSKSNLSLECLFDQMKQEKGIKTVYLDLRSENHLFCQINQNLNPSADNTIKPVDDCKDSSDDDDEEESNENPNISLWIDNYRKSKSADKKNNLKNSNDAKNKEIKSENKLIYNEIQVENVRQEIVFDDAKERNHVDLENDDKVPEHIQLKIEKIKQQEKILSERRFIINQLKELVEHSDSYPVLLHEEVTFESNTNKLTPELIADSENKYFNIFISISPPNNVMTISKVQSPFSVDHPKENFIALISLILKSTDQNSKTHLPFQVVAFQQIYYQNQLQLALLCLSDLSLTKLRMDLRNCTLRNIFNDNNENCEDSNQVLSNLPLSNIFRLQPHDVLLTNNIWLWNNSSIIWHKISVKGAICESNSKTRNLDTNTSSVILGKEFFMSEMFKTFLHLLLNRFTVSGMRLFLNSCLVPDYDSQVIEINCMYTECFKRENVSQFVLAVRGFDVIRAVKIIQNQPEFRNKAMCTRFKENSYKEMCKYFGPRLNEEQIKELVEKDNSRYVANELSYGISLYNSLCWSQPTDVMLLVSPMILDIGWILNILYEKGGYLLINIVRINLSSSTGRQIGIPENELDNFEKKNGSCHLLVIRNENPLHSLKFVLRECMIFMNNNELNENRFFYMTPYSDALMNILDIRRSFQTPEVRELISNMSDAPFDDCERCAFVLIISDEFTKHAAQILDQMTNLDLLAIKCFANELDQDHMNLIKSQFNIRFPNLSDDSEADGPEIRMRIGVIAIRSMYVIRELEKIHNTIKIEKNLIFAYTITVEASFRMIASFFTSMELVSDPRRRSTLKFLPESLVKDLAQKSIIAQFPILYSSIKTIFIVQINKSESVLSRFRKFWFLLSRDGFSIVKSSLDSNGKLYFIVERPNAIFYLIQWMKYHFSDEFDSKIEICANPEDFELFLRKIPTNITYHSVLSMNRTTNCELALLVIKCNLLQSSVEMLSNTKMFWNMLEDNKIQYLALSVVDVNGSMIYKLRNIAILNPSGVQLAKETRYLCIVAAGRISSIITSDLIKSNLGFMKSDSELSDDVYANYDFEQIIQCCEILLLHESDSIESISNRNVIN